MERIALPMAFDSSPDWLAPVVSNVSLNPEYVDGLLKIWDDEVQGAADPDAQLELLRTALRRDSMVHAVEDLGYRAPIVYGWSPLDERIDPATSRPAADAIGANYGSSPHQILDWQVPDHAPSNRDIGQARSIVEWLGTELGPLPPEPEPDPETPEE